MISGHVQYWLTFSTRNIWLCVVALDACSDNDGNRVTAEWSIAEWQRRLESDWQTVEQWKKTISSSTLLLAHQPPYSKTYYRRRLHRAAAAAAVVSTRSYVCVSREIETTVTARRSVTTELRRVLGLSLAALSLSSVSGRIHSDN